ncbi:MAG: hypothetical protein A3K18_28150, partial [Lentisphaerae bacterium RIFOXYA12_64_32]
MRLAGSNHSFFMQPAMRTDVARNRYAESLLASDFTHLLMLDCDHDHPVDLVQRLSRRVEEDPSREIIGALCFRRSPPYDPLAIRETADGRWLPIDGQDVGVVPCDVVGTGAILIARTVFERLARPWFYYDYQGAAMDLWPGEDTSFCIKAREAGIQAWVDTSTVSPHLGEVAVEREIFLGHVQSVGGGTERALGDRVELDLLRAEVPWLFKCRRILCVGTEPRHVAALGTSGAVVDVREPHRLLDGRWDAALWCLDRGEARLEDPFGTLSALESVADRVVLLAPLVEDAPGTVCPSALEPLGYEGVTAGEPGDPTSHLVAWKTRGEASNHDLDPQRSAPVHARGLRPVVASDPGEDLRAPAGHPAPDPVPGPADPLYRVHRHVDLHGPGASPAVVDADQRRATGADAGGPAASHGVE